MTEEFVFENGSSICEASCGIVCGAPDECVMKDTYTRSLIFCKERASDPSVSNLADRDYSDATEIRITDLYFKSALGEDFMCGRAYLTVTGTNEKGERHEYEVELKYDPQCEDFQYFTSEQYVSDGTAIFLHESFSRIVSKVACAQTYNTNIGEPQNGDKIRYTFGNFVVLNEFDGDFVPKDKRWLRERTTVLLPLKMEKL